MSSESVLDVLRTSTVLLKPTNTQHLANMLNSHLFYGTSQIINVGEPFMNIRKCRRMLLNAENSNILNRSRNLEHARRKHFCPNLMKRGKASTHFSD